MRQKEKKVVITFASTTDAMAMESCCREAGVPGRAIPAPSEISAGCGWAWSAPAAERGVIERALQEHRLAYEGVFLVDLY
jgi:hypothetical protein